MPTHAKVPIKLEFPKVFKNVSPETLHQLSLSPWLLLPPAYQTLSIAIHLMDLPLHPVDLHLLQAAILLLRLLHLLDQARRILVQAVVDRSLFKLQRRSAAQEAKSADITVADLTFVVKV